MQKIQHQNVKNLKIIDTNLGIKAKDRVKIKRNSTKLSSSMKGHSNKINQEVSENYFEWDFDGKLFGTRIKLKGHMKNHRLKVKCESCQIEVMSVNMQRHIIKLAFFSFRSV